jgi:hypothetical protein
MADEFKLPNERGAVFWPVGTGDSTTFVLRPGKIVMQVDLRHLEKADDPDEPEWAIIDQLVKMLPKRNGRPYLAVFALTHPDRDHIQGFKELMKKVDIGELWHTPKIYRDHEEDGTVMCDDALAFRKEAHRRRDAMIDDPDNVTSGNRIRVIGHDDILNEDDYVGLPDDSKSRPGDKVSLVDGIDLSGEFQAFIHAPFKDDQESDKNDTSLSLNIVLWEGEKYAQFFLFGDRAYPGVTQIFDVTEAGKNKAYLYWDVMLCSHHCSKKVMYWKDEGEDEATFKKDIMDRFEKYARKGAYIVSSSHSNFTDGDGDNPPHKSARTRYEEIVKAGGFICTHEHPSKKSPEPLVFTVNAQGLQLKAVRSAGTAASALSAAVTTARGSTQPPGVQVGFGQSK